MQFNTEQLRAITYCTDLHRRVVSISGPAGTGKTTIIQQAVAQLRSMSRRVALAAPTGRAARRIQEATGYSAVTIHKLLGYGKPAVDESTGLPTEETLPTYNAKAPLPYQDVFVDEYMMVNEDLHRDLMSALPSGGRLLAFGDAHQLPPIEPWEYKGIEEVPFERILKLPSAVHLEMVYRQAEGSGLLDNARRIRIGRPPTKCHDFDITVTEIPIKVLLDHVEKSGIDYSTLDNQVISAARQGQLGTHALNAALQVRIGPSRDTGVSLPRDKWAEKYPIEVRVGEKVICNENIYDLRDFYSRFSRWTDEDIPVWSSYIPCPDAFTMLNGEVGVIEDVLPDGSLYIRVADRVVQFPSSYRDYNARYNRVYQRDARKKLDLAYCITTHKMQGSECEHVVYLMHRAIRWALNRNNLYTGVTRARRAVHLITDGASLQTVPKYSAAQKARASQQKGWSVGDTSK